MARRPAAFDSSAPGGEAALTSTAPPSTADILRSALGKTVETERTGSAVAEQLAAQREQIERTARKVDEIEAHADRGHHILKGMSSMLNSIKNKFSRQPELPAEVVAKREAERSARRAALEAELDRAQAAAEAASAGSRAGAKGAGKADGKGAASPAATRAAGDSKVFVSKDPRYHEEDVLLAQISQSLVGVKAHAETIHAELSLHNAMLDDLGESIDRTTDKLDSAAMKARKLAK